MLLESEASVLHLLLLLDELVLVADKFWFLTMTLVFFFGASILFFARVHMPPKHISLYTITDTQYPSSLH